MPGAVEILQGLGAERQRDGSWRLDVRTLRLTSIFGGPLQGDGALTIRGDDVAFVRPAELALCDGLSLRGLDDADGFRELVADLHGDMRARANAHLATLRRLGFKPAIQAPLPRPRADVDVGDVTATVSISGSGHLVVDAVDGTEIPAALGTIAPAAGLVPADALRRIGVVVNNVAQRGSATNAGDPLSQDDLDELHNALHDELDDSDEGGAFDDADDDEYEPTVVGVPPPQRRDDVRLAPRVDDRRPLGGHEWDGGTAPSENRATGRPTVDQERPFTIEAMTADIVRSVRPTPAVPAPASAPRDDADRGGGLLDEFDDDEPPAGGDDVDAIADEGSADDGAAVENDGFELVAEDDSVSLKDDNGDNNDDDSDPLADLATAAMKAAPLAAPPTRAEPASAPPVRDSRAPSAARAPSSPPAPRRSVDEEEDDLLAALGGGDDARFGEDALAGRPTTISVTPRAARDLVSSSASDVRARATPAPPRSRVLDDDRDEAPPAPVPPVRAATSTTRAPAPAVALAAPAPPPPGADDDDFGAAASFDDDDNDFADAKTRALSVDAALLDRLKRGDGDAPLSDGDGMSPPHDVEAAKPSPVVASLKPTRGGSADVRADNRVALPVVGSDRRDDDDDDDDDGAGGFDSQAAVTHVGNGDPRTALSPPTAAVTAPPPSPPPIAAPVVPVVPVAPVAPRSVAPVDDANANDNDDDDGSSRAPGQHQKPAPALVAPQAARRPSDVDDAAEVAQLRARAAHLRQELDDILARIELLTAEQESTTTKPMPPHPGDAAPARQARAIGLSGVELSSRAAPSSTVAPPIITDEGEFAAVGQSEDDDVINSATTPQPLPAPRADAAAVVDGVAADRRAVPARNDLRARSAPFAADAGSDSDAGARDDGGDDDGGDEDGVSLADLQGALREMGVDVADEGTQVKAVDVPADVDGDGDDGDVFGSAGAGADEEDLLVDEPTNIRPPQPGTIALVVEDGRARDRLKKHLEPRFTALFEAEDAQAAVDLDELDSLDAIVFVRPSRSEPNQQGFAQIGRLPRRPRVLVISADAAYDEHPGVDLRLPLGQKASEVARQVLDGLERLGVQAAAE
jgi:hypothetical protein